MPSSLLQCSKPNFNTGNMFATSEWLPNNTGKSDSPLRQSGGHPGFDSRANAAGQADGMPCSGRTSSVPGLHEPRKLSPYISLSGEGPASSCFVASFEFGFTTEY